ncbi:MAG: histidinol-phosphate transaminase [Vicinamibacterales bacterium]
MSYQIPPAPASGLRLHLNENTGGCSPAVIDALRALGTTDVSRYPDVAPARARAAEWLGVPPEMVLLTNGLDEGLHLVAQAARLRAPDGRVLIPEPAFEMYAAAASAAGLGIDQVMPTEDLGFDLDAVLAAIGPATSLIHLTDPNNPTGVGLPAGALDAVAAAAPGALVLMDEAYADFSGRTTAGTALESRPHVIVGRTFSKGHGLAGLRVGALVAHPETIASLRRLQPAFSVNVCALAALQAALGDPAHLQGYLADVARSRRLVAGACEARGWRTWPSETNFVFVRIGDALPQVVAALARQGIFIRDKSAAPGCAGCARITIGTADQTLRLLAALEAA